MRFLDMGRFSNFLRGTFWVLLISSIAACASSKQYSLTEVMVAEDGYAIHGYDPVSYFTDGEPSKGSEEFSYEWKEATWLFSSAEHRDLFKESPEKYAPQYGGWCAYGAAGGYAADVDPLESWTIHDDKLYLNYDKSVSKKWNKDIPGYLEKADEKWPKLNEELQEGTAKVYWK